MLNDLRVGTRLAFGFACVVGVFLATLLAVGFMLSGLKDNVIQINDDTLPSILAVSDMNLSRSEVQQFLTDVSATRDPSAFAEAQVSADRFQTSVAKFKRAFQQTGDTANYQRMESLEADFNAFYASGKRMANAYISKGVEAGNLLMNGTPGERGFDHASEVIMNSLNAFRQSQVGQASQVSTGAVKNVNALLTGISVGSALAAVLAMLLALWIVRSITHPVRQAVHVLNTVATGDLTMRYEVSGKCETAQLLSAIQIMQGNLSQVVSTVREGAQEVSTASAEIAVGSLDLSARTESQASALEQTAASMEQLSATVKTNADSARRANQLAQNASSVAARSGAVVSQVVDTMKGINDASYKIRDIIQVVDGIAFQTNILALNAAVEAARAGEQGRGFSVVASEVRSLAGRSATAAKEIKVLINSSFERVEQGSVLVAQAGTTMTEVVSSIRCVTDIMGEISAANIEQAAGVSQVGDAVIQMDQVTQQNAALVEEMSAAAASLQSQARELVQVVAVFNLGHASMKPSIAI